MSIQPGPGYTFSSSSLGTTLNIQQPWSAWANYAIQENEHPFKIVNVRLVTVGGTTTVRYQVVSGTLNNLVPLIDDVATGLPVLLNRTTAGVADPPTAELTSTDYEAGTKTAYITLRAGAMTASPYTYPDSNVSSNQYPVIIGSNQITPDDDVWGFLNIGTISVDNVTAPTAFTVSQNVTGSLWADRIKVNGMTARYYYARI